MPKDMPESTIKVMTAFNDIGWLIPLVGIVEVIGGILFITNRYRALGAIIILPVMTGILLTNIFNAPEGLPIALVLAIINVWALIDNRAKYKPLFR